MNCKELAPKIYAIINKHKKIILKRFFYKGTSNYTMNFLKNVWYKLCIKIKNNTFKTKL